MKNQPQSATTSLWSQNAVRDKSLHVPVETAYFFNTSTRGSDWKKLFLKNPTQYFLYRQIWQMIKKNQPVEGKRKVLFVNAPAETLIDFKTLFDRQIELTTTHETRILGDIVHQKIKERGVWVNVVEYSDQRIEAEDQAFDVVVMWFTDTETESISRLFLELRRLVRPATQGNLLAFFSRPLQVAQPSLQALRGVALGAHLVKPAFFSLCQFSHTKQPALRFLFSGLSLLWAYSRIHWRSAGLLLRLGRSR